jgi:hypothetical protein
MRLGVLAAATLAMLTPAGANAATTVTFNGACGSSATATQAICTSVAGGGSVSLTATNDATLQVRISAWQVDLSTDLIRSAALGAFSNGFGVTGGDDSGGANSLHTFDNLGGYTDFVMLQFNRAVKLTGIIATSMTFHPVAPQTRTPVSPTPTGSSRRLRGTRRSIWRAPPPIPPSGLQWTAMAPRGRPVSPAAAFRPYGWWAHRR